MGLLGSTSSYPIDWHYFLKSPNIPNRLYFDWLYFLFRLKMQALYSRLGSLKDRMTNISPAVFGYFVAGTTTLGTTIYFSYDHLFSFDKPFGQKKDEQHDALVAILQTNVLKEKTLNMMFTVLEKHSETERKLLEYARMMQEDIREYQLAKQKGCCICRFCRGC